jgi:hypothetical protein
MSFHEFSQFSFPGQTGTRVAWELTGYYRARSKLLKSEIFTWVPHIFLYLTRISKTELRDKSVRNSFHCRHFPLHRHSTNLGDRERSVNILMAILYKGQEINGYFAPRGKPSHIKILSSRESFMFVKNIQFDRL